MDEVVSISKSTKMRDMQSSSVILDFKTRSVIKCSIGEQIGTREFQIVRDYYHTHYAKLIEGLEAAYDERTNHTG